jgi:hypothetical protein
MDEDQLNLMNKAVFGRQVEEFLTSDIGRFLLNKADRELAEAIGALRDCQPEDLLKHQFQMKRAESIRGWLREAIEEGLRALNLLEGMEDEDQ